VAPGGLWKHRLVSQGSPLTDALALFHLASSFAASDILGLSLISSFLGTLLLFWGSYISLVSGKYISGELFKTLLQYS